MPLKDFIDKIKPMINKLRIIPFYTGFRTLEEALKDKRAEGLLWLEILFNDDIDWRELDLSVIKESYKKACLWYENFRTLIDSYIKRKPLKGKKGKVDLKEYRRFLEVLNFVST